jgi:glycosyltransferase involved in cell wall biosynthesis
MPPPAVGARAQSEELGERLAALGWRVSAVSHLRGRLTRAADMVTSAWRWRDRYEVAEVDVFSGAAFRWAEAVCAVLRAARKPYVLTLHGGNLPAFARTQAPRVRRLLAGAAAVTAPSHYLFEGMRAYREDLLQLPNALDVGSFAFRPRDSATPRLVWVRAFHEVYNPVLAVRVLAAVAAERPDVRLVMIGRDKDGSLARVREAARRLGVEDRLELPGPVPHGEIVRWLAGADVFLNTTNVDNTPVSVLEAQAAGLCVVSTNVGGLPFLLESGRDALLVPPDDAPAMAAAVLRVVSEPPLALALAASGHDRVQRFDWSHVLPQWEALLTRVIERGRP